MIDSMFEYLSGIVTIPAAAPESWLEVGLDEFYINPNSEKWGDDLCRFLYHESIHFWQIISSGYLANIIADDWKRLLEYEENGIINSRSSDARNYDKRHTEFPFSARELVECWARYWDVHTRSPAKILSEEKSEILESKPAEIRFEGKTTSEYTSHAFDMVMQAGKDCIMYAEPYRWMLDRASGDSAFVAISFPIIAHSAFGSPDPVGVFCDSFDRALHSDIIQEGFPSKLFGNINLDWLNNWSVIIGEAVSPTLDEKNLPSFTSGFDVIQRGILGSHPIYSNYLGRVKALHLQLTMLQPVTKPPLGDLDALENYALLDMASKHPWVVFGLPGQPTYRTLLGRGLSPPKVCFVNFNLYASRAKPIQNGKLEFDKERFESLCKSLEPRIRRFRNADKAVSLGLSPTAFE